MVKSYEDMELLALISAARERDDDAFFKLLTRYKPMFNRVISAFVNPDFSRNEAFSEACLAFHRAVMSYDISKSTAITFGLYSRICVYRRLRDFTSGRKTVPMVEVDIDLISTDANIEQNLVGRERMLKIQNKVRALLSEYEYSVFCLYIEGDSTAEIAKKLGKNLKSVENAKSRMFKHIREESDMFSDF